MVFNRKNVTETSKQFFNLFKVLKYLRTCNIFYLINVNRALQLAFLIDIY